MKNTLTVRADPDQEGWYLFYINDEGSDVSYPTYDKAAEAGQRALRLLEPEEPIPTCPHCGAKDKIIVCETVKHWYQLALAQPEDNYYETGEALDKYDECADISFMCDKCRRSLELEDIVVKALEPL